VSIAGGLSSRLIQRLRKTLYESVLVFEIGEPAVEIPTYLKEAKLELERSI
jgi:hypothetical protein